MTRLILMLACLLAALPVRAQSPTGAAAFRSERILVETRGQGPDVVLIPGLASTSTLWRRTADRLADRYRVHLVTVRGFGPTDPGANASGALSGPVTVELERYMVQAGLERPALIGHSLGGQIALRAAADQGRRVGRVMVVDAAPFFPSLIRSDARPGDVESLARIVYSTLLLLGDDALKAQVQALGVDLGGASGAIFGTLGWQGGDRRVLAQGLYEVMTVDLRGRLADVAAPVTVVYGWSADDMNPRAQVDALFRAGYRGLRTPARFERIEGAEHMVMIDRPDAFQAAVERFLR
ncbi:MAG: alpha/beta hydrolase [Brevundimonas sp.]|uniref:alpha/beta fold hydrolase n=1 Tax=Brevundimonas sp. TaxID=1871086 RepID=UPI0025C4655C|nr:alpha/beta hydrolase [Brevundimonas sp.]MBX3477477.1 alpha/beta hydrolase [Brevundimonas sp.]